MAVAAALFVLMMAPFNSILLVDAAYPWASSCHVILSCRGCFLGSEFQFCLVGIMVEKKKVCFCWIMLMLVGLDFTGEESLSSVVESLGIAMLYILVACW